MTESSVAVELSPNMTQRNYRLGVLNGALYLFAETLLDPTLVLVSFLSQLTQSPFLLGLVLPIRDGAWSLPQLWVSGYLQSQPIKIVWYRRLSALRITSWGLLAATIAFVHDPTILLIGFFLCFTLGSLASGLSGLPFLEIVSKTVPPRRRGEFFAWRFGLGGLAGVGGSFFVRWLVDPNGPVAAPANFAILAFSFFVVASVSLLVFNRIDETVPDPVLPRAQVGAQLRRAAAYTRADRNFRSFVGMQSANMVAGAATPFFAVFVQRQLGGSLAMVGSYLLVITATNLALNFLFGRVSLRFGNRRVMVFATLAGTLMATMVILLAMLAGPLHISSTAASLWLIPVYVLSAVRSAGMGIAGTSLLLEMVPGSDRSLYIGFYNSLLGIVLLLTGLSGLVVSAFGYLVLFFVTLGAHGWALWSALHLKTDPAIS